MCKQSSWFVSLCGRNIHAPICECASLDPIWKAASKCYTRVLVAEGCTICVSLCGYTVCVRVCLCVVITSKPSDEILSFLSASRQHEHMSMATSHKSRGKPMKDWNKKIRKERGNTRKAWREGGRERKSSWGRWGGERKCKDRMQSENPDWENADVCLCVTMRNAISSDAIF